MPQLDFTTFYSQIFWLLLCCMIVFFVINGVFSSRMQYIFVSRQRKISKDLYEAEQSIALCKQINSDMEKTICESKSNALSVRQEAWNKAENFLKTELAKINKAMDKKEKVELEKLSRYKAQFRAASLDSSEELAQSIIHKLKNLCNISTSLPN